jgi:hypothetical protein
MILQDSVLPNVLFSRRASGGVSETLPNVAKLGISLRGSSERKRGRLECGLGSQQWYPYPLACSLKPYASSTN